jgi:hypothetical protein
MGGGFERVGRYVGCRVSEYESSRYRTYFTHTSFQSPLIPRYRSWSEKKSITQAEADIDIPTERGEWFK